MENRPSHSGDHNLKAQKREVYDMFQKYRQGDQKPTEATAQPQSQPEGCLDMSKGIKAMYSKAFLSKEEKERQREIKLHAVKDFTEASKELEQVWSYKAVQDYIGCLEEHYQFVDTQEFSMDRLTEMKEKVESLHRQMDEEELSEMTEGRDILSFFKDQYQKMEKAKTAMEGTKLGRKGRSILQKMTMLLSDVPERIDNLQARVSAKDFTEAYDRLEQIWSHKAVQDYTGCLEEHYQFVDTQEFSMDRLTEMKEKVESLHRQMDEEELSEMTEGRDILSFFKDQYQKMEKAKTAMERTKLGSEGHGVLQKMTELLRNAQKRIDDLQAGALVEDFTEGYEKLEQVWGREDVQGYIECRKALKELYPNPQESSIEQLTEMKEEAERLKKQRRDEALPETTAGQDILSFFKDQYRKMEAAKTAIEEKNLVNGDNGILQKMTELLRNAQKRVDDLQAGVSGEPPLLADVRKYPSNLLTMVDTVIGFKEEVAKYESETLAISEIVLEAAQAYLEAVDLRGLSDNVSNELKPYDLRRWELGMINRRKFLEEFRKDVEINFRENRDRAKNLVIDFKNKNKEIQDIRNAIEKLTESSGIPFSDGAETRIMTLRISNLKSDSSVSDKKTAGLQKYIEDADREIKFLKESEKNALETIKWSNKPPIDRKIVSGGSTKGYTSGYKKVSADTFFITNDPRFGVSAGVFDGVGGSGNAHLAAKMASDYIQGQLKTIPDNIPIEDAKERIKQIIIDANTKICMELPAREGERSGSLTAFVVVKIMIGDNGEKTAIICHGGDCRAIEIEEGSSQKSGTHPLENLGQEDHDKSSLANLPQNIKMFPIEHLTLDNDYDRSNKLYSDSKGVSSTTLIEIESDGEDNPPQWDIEKQKQISGLNDFSYKDCPEGLRASLMHKVHGEIKNVLGAMKYAPVVRGVDVKLGRVIALLTDGAHNSLPDQTLAGMFAASPDPQSGIENVVEEASKKGKNYDRAKRGFQRAIPEDVTGVAFVAK